MKIVLCGLPASGKSTVFKALVGRETQARTSSSGKIQLNIGTLEVKDERLEKLAQIVNSEKITYPKITLIDLVNPTESSRKIDTSHIKEFDVLVLILGVFSSEEPLEDLINIESELMLSDLQVVQDRIERVKKERKARPKREEDPELLLLERCARTLEEEKFVKDLRLSREELKMLAGFQLLTLKPIIAIANISEQQLSKGIEKGLEEKIEAKGLKFLSLCAKLEAEIEELREEERPKFLKEMGLSSLSKDRFIEACFQARDLISFFTVVGKEARAWPVLRKTTALQAAGCIHSDMERGFIRAEVINYKDFIERGSFAKAKEKGLLRLESKDYPVQDGDIINFKFSV